MTHQKVCPKCKESKLLSQFYKSKNTKDGLRSCCKGCMSIESYAYSKTIPGLVTAIYAIQRRNSKKRNMDLPSYTKLDLKSWIINQANFNELYCNWIESDYKTELKPSVDRLDDYKPYTMSNIQLMTWGENKSKSHKDRKAGTNKKQLKAVISYNKTTKEMTEYYSAAEAARRTGIDASGVIKCCKGTRKTAGGFNWEYKE